MNGYIEEFSNLFFDKLIDIHDTYEIIEGIMAIIRPYESSDKPIPQPEVIDALIALKLKEYLIVQLRALLCETNKFGDSISLKELLDIYSRKDRKDVVDLIEKFKNSNKNILYKINLLRNKVLVHNELFLKGGEIITNNNVEETRDNISNDDLKNLIIECERLIRNLSFLCIDDGFIPDPCLGYVMPEAVKEWVLSRQTGKKRV